MKNQKELLRICVEYIKEISSNENVYASNGESVSIADLDAALEAKKEVPKEGADIRLISSLESTLTNVTNDLRNQGFPHLAGRVESEIGDLQDAIIDGGLELGEH